MITSKRVRRPLRATVCLIAVLALTVSNAGTALANHVHTYPSWSPSPLPTTKSVKVSDLTPAPTAQPVKPAPQSVSTKPVWPAASTRQATISPQATKPVPVSATPVTLAVPGQLTQGRLRDPGARRASVALARLPHATAATVRVASHQAATAAGVDGLVLSLQQPNTATAATTQRGVSVAVDYSGFADAYGGDYADRLHLVQLPACALTTPGKAACRAQQPVPASVNDAAHHTLDADVAVPAVTKAATPGSAAAQPLVLAAVSAPNGGGGDYRATSLNPAGSWTVGNTGAFTYSYPISVPPSVGGDAPSVGLSYDSSSVDGRTSNTNAQASWVGDGWDYSPGFIERSYKTCSDDGQANDSDECWAGDNATVSLAGHSGRLVPTSSADTKWRLQDDDGSVIDEITVSSSSAYFNGMNAGTYWRLTANDGTQYFFGADHLPSSAGGTGTDTSTNAAWGAPVFGDDSGEPCHGSTFAASRCTQGWRWNLDFTVDPHKNITVYRYATESNYYAATSAHTLVGYTRAGELTSISYGQQVADYVAKAAAGAEVDFTTTGRCDGQDGFSCATAISASNASHFPDVPYDQNCASSGSCTNYAPTFWSTKALSKITTKVWDESLSTPGWSAVDSYTLSAPSFPAPGDSGLDGGNAKGALWLTSITHTGTDTRGGGAAASTSATTFTGAALPNRVDGLNMVGVGSLNRYRITSIGTQTGGEINVSYQTDEACKRGDDAPAEDNDHTRCYPQRWSPPGYTDPILDWFYTYPVITIAENNNNTLWAGSPSPSHVTSYAYSDPAWHRDDSPYTPDKNRTWGQFRGYGLVTTTTGKDPDPLTKTVTHYLQGMDQDVDKDGHNQPATVTTATGDTITDSRPWAGMVYQSTTYSSASGTPQDETISYPWFSAATATQAITGLPDLVARYTGVERSDTRSLLANGTWRTARVNTSFDPDTGLTTKVDDLGQIDSNGNPTGATTPEACTTTSYATNTARNMLDYPAQVITASGGCATDAGAHTVKASRAYYGSTTLGTVADNGDTTKTQALKTAGSTPVWAAATTSVYDAYGRITSVTDPMGRTTTTSYGTTTTRSKYLPVSSVVTDNAHNATTTTLDPARQLPISVTDVNGRVTSETYDGLGRLTAVWLPNHTKASYPSTPSMKYAYQVSATNYIAVTSSSLLDDGQYRLDIAIYDALLQQRQQQTSPGDMGSGSRLISNTGYDSHGWAVTSDAPFYNTQSAPSTTPNTAIYSESIPDETRTTYDARGRTIHAALYSNGAYQWQTSTAYPGADETDTTPPAGGVETASEVDARGQQTQLEQDPGGAHDNITYYSYDAAGHQTSIVGPLPPGVSATGSPLTWTTSYDALGNVARSTDPDAGTTTNTYDDISNLTSTTTTGNEPGASTRTVSYDYASDPLGRKTAEYDGTGTGRTKIAAWTYDTATGGKEQPRSETEYAADGTTPTYTSTVTGYTAAYKPTSTSMTIPAGTYGNTDAINYQTQYAYTPVLSNVTDEVIDETGTNNLMPEEDYGFSYNDAGLPAASGGLSPYVTNTNYDPHGRVLRAVTGIMPKQTAVTNSWDEPTGRLRNTTFSVETGATSAVDNIDYTYNPAGQITSATDQRGGTGTPDVDRQCYNYDDLNRLTDVWTDTGATTGDQAVGRVGTCVHTTPATGNIDGPAPYWQSYSYDLTGNRIASTDHAVTDGPPSTSTSETYTGTGDAHAVHTVTAGADTTTYSYDGGNPTSTTTTTAGTSDPSKTQTFTWNAQGQLAKLTLGPASDTAHTTSYGYDPDGNQIARTTDGVTTLTLGIDTLTLTAGAVTQDVREYAFPGGQTSVRVATTDQSATATDALHYEATDPQGTATTDVTAQTLAVSRHAYTPYGVDRTNADTGTTWPTEAQRGFLNALQDDTNDLTTLGAREYDPTLGRFLTADPILETADPQALNGYTYSDGNPVNQSDPTGLCNDYCNGYTPRPEPPPIS